jgi:hypothetical protein
MLTSLLSPRTLKACALAFVVGLVGATGSPQPSMAVTLTFDAASATPYVENGFQIDVVSLVSGNCDGTSGAKCLALGPSDTATLTKVGGGVFTLADFGFEFQGNPSTLTVKSYSNATLVDTVPITDAKNLWYSFSSYHGPLANITSILFADTGTGNIRIDDIYVASGETPVVPIPGALPLFGTGLGGVIGLLYLRRKQKRAPAIEASI